MNARIHNTRAAVAYQSPWIIANVPLMFSNSTPFDPVSVSISICSEEGNVCRKKKTKFSACMVVNAIHVCECSIIIPKSPLLVDQAALICVELTMLCMTACTS